MILTPKLRRHTYLNLVLSLSVTGFLFGFITFFNSIRKSFESISSNGVFFCFLSILIISSPMVETLYQTFLIGFYILSELDLNGARCYLKTDENTFGIQSARQYQLYHCHFCTILLAMKIMQIVR